MSSAVYRGRFAPSPTGPLHFGSLVAAVASFADARHQGGQWLVRIEDVDQTRRRDGAERHILATLSAFGMRWDESPVRQSERGPLYRTALNALSDAGHAYRCSCSRKTIAAIARTGPEGPIYPGICRMTPPPADRPAAWRLVVDDQTINFTDRVVGEVSQRLASEIGDFVIHRLDGFTAYQLAVVVDDHAQRISDVVRGADLLWSTPRQIWLQRLLGLPTPRYAHIPLVFDADGHKLSKSDAAHPVDDRDPVRSLLGAWAHLGQMPPETPVQNVEAFWRWAIPRWESERVPADRNRRHDDPDPV